MKSDDELLPGARAALAAFLMTMEPDGLGESVPVALVTEAREILQEALEAGEAPAPLSPDTLQRISTAPGSDMLTLREALRHAMADARLWSEGVSRWLDRWVMSTLAVLGDRAPASTQPAWLIQGLEQVAYHPLPTLQRTAEQPSRQVLQAIVDQAVSEPGWAWVAVVGPWTPNNPALHPLAVAGLPTPEGEPPWLGLVASHLAARSPGFLLAEAEAGAEWDNAASLWVLPLLGVGHEAVVIGRESPAPPDEAEIQMGQALLGVASIVALFHRLGQEMQVEAQMRDGFLSILNHDLKSPLASIKAQADLLTRRVQRGKLDLQSPDGQHDLVDRLAQIGDRTRELASQIDQVVESSRLEMGRLTIHAQEESLTDALRANLEEVQLIYPQRPFWIEIPEDPLWAEFDAFRIGQVFKILINNAVKFSPDDQPITVRLDREDSMARLEVEDRGVGMAPDEAEALMFQAPLRQRRQRVQAGTGMNLFIACGLISLHQGTIEVHTAPGEGTRFVVRLPLARLI